MEAIIPHDLDIKQDSIYTLINKFHQSSINGLKVELFDDKNLNKEHVFTLLPTLSSLYLMAEVQSKNPNKS